MTRSHAVWIALALTLGGAWWASGLEEESAVTARTQGGRSETPPRRAGGRKTETGVDRAALLTRLELGQTTRDTLPRLQQDPFTSRSFAPPPPPPAPAAAPVAPPLRFKYMGRLEEDENSAVFLDLNGQLLVARTGETLPGQYKVLEIGERSMHFEFLPLAERQILNYGR